MRHGLMSNVFHLLDLASQSIAVQKFLEGKTVPEKLAWLSRQGDLSLIPISIPDTAPTYRFVSRIKIECIFFINEDRFVFIGDHTIYTIND
jgi:hypothetical protein